MIRKIYLKLSLQSLAIGAVVNAAIEGAWIAPLSGLLSRYFMERQWDRFILAAAEVLGLFLWNCNTCFATIT